MSFSAKGVSQSFSRTNSGSARAPRKRDILMTIESYDFGARQINGVDEQGNKIAAIVNPETIARVSQRPNTSATPAKWQGHSIDQAMADHLKIGDKIVLESAVPMGTLSLNGSSVKKVQTDYIRNTRDPSPEKTFEGLFSISADKGRIFLVQRWEQKAYLVSDAAKMQHVYDLFDEASEKYKNGEPVATYGFQARVVIPSENPKDPCIVYDLSPPIDWIQRQLDENKTEIAPGRPLDSQKLKEILFAEDGYIPYADNLFPLESYPTRFYEIAIFRNYRAGPMSRQMEIPDRQYDPFYIMSRTPTRLALDDSSFVTEKNIAVLGVLQLSADKPDPANRTFITRNLAVQLHANGPKGHVHSWVRTHDDRITRPHEKLKQQTNSTKNDSAQNSTSSHPEMVPFADPIQTNIREVQAVKQAPSSVNKNESDFDFDDDWDFDKP